MVKWVEIGDCKLALGDCREILPTLGKVDAIVTDPPYGISHRRGTSKSRPNGRHAGAVKSLGVSRIIGDDTPFDPSILLQWPCLMWGANYYQVALPRGRWLVWDKIEHGGSGDFSEAEIAWCSIPGATKIFRHMWMGVQRASQTGEPRQHPTEKPVALMEWCVGFLPDAEVIADPFMGSGTTGIACVRASRSFVGIECDPVHFETACRRIEAAYKQPDFFVAPVAKLIQEPLL
jgi:site-specific DNA-methyltransferase (adenine-specific)